MRILFVSPFPPAQDGIGTYTKNLIVALAAAGHEAAVVLPRRHAFPSDGVIGALGTGQSERDILRDAVRDWAPDVIHVQFAVAAFGTRTRALLSWLRGIRSATDAPVIVTMHEVTRDTAMLRGPGRALYRLIARLSDQVIVHTRTARDALTGQIGVPADKVRIIPHPEPDAPRVVTTSDNLRQRFGLGNGEVLLAFGFIHVDKGLDDLVAAVGMLNEAADPGLAGSRLVIAGTVRPRQGLFRIFELRDRRHLAAVLRRARRDKIDSSIVLTGFVPEADMAGWFQTAAAVVLPYRRTEESGVASLAGAFGVPVIASTAGGLGERYAGSPWTFEPGDRRELASVIARFLSAPTDHREIAVSPVASVVDLGSIVTATSDVYRSVALMADTPA
jgi:glycosyltransferase involved in cell wall biosynthesis